MIAAAAERLPAADLPFAGSLRDRIEREIVLHRTTAADGRLRADARAVHARTAELLTEALRYMADRDRALAERVNACAQLRAELEARL